MQLPDSLPCCCLLKAGMWVRTVFQTAFDWPLLNTHKALRERGSERETERRVVTALSMPDRHFLSLHISFVFLNSSLSLVFLIPFSFSPSPLSRSSTNALLWSHTSPPPFSHSLSLSFPKSTLPLYFYWANCVTPVAPPPNAVKKTNLFCIQVTHIQLINF